MAHASAQFRALAAIAVACTIGLGADAQLQCTPPSTIPPVPTNVSDLHPGHVSIVMAFGDSITAAFAARGEVLEDRDISWAIGRGNATQLTMPYILNEYTAAAHGAFPLQGMSNKAVVPRDILHMPHNDYHPATDLLNFAESEGAVHRGSLDEQWGFMTQHIDEYKDAKTRWKVITLWMTANDVCGECDGPIDLRTWTKKTNQFLLNISTTFQNVYVNLMGTLDLSQIARIQRSNVECTVIHKYLLEECGCIDRGNATQLKQLDANVHAMNAVLHNLSATWHAKLAAEGRGDMAVVMQGFLEGHGREFDRDFLSKLDCFHPSASAHQLLGVNLWNSMLCHDRDNCSFNLNPTVTCPTATSTFYTGPG